MPTAWHPNGRVAFDGTIVWHENGRVAVKGNTAWHENGRLAVQGGAAFHANGRQAKTGSTTFHDNGRIAGKEAPNLRLALGPGIAVILDDEGITGVDLHGTVYSDK